MEQNKWKQLAFQISVAQKHILYMWLQPGLKEAVV